MLKQKVLSLLVIITMAFLLLPINTKALTYNEILSYQQGKVLGDSITAPTGLQYQCNTNGDQVTLSWNAATGANYYLLRLNDTSNDSASTTQWGWYNAGTTDTSNDNIAQTSFSTKVIPGNNYTWWVHSYYNSNSTASPAVFGTFTCSKPAPASLSPTGLQNQCNASGTQVTLSWLPVSGASNYLLRLNYTSDDNSNSQYGWYDANTTDISSDNVGQTSFLTPVIPGKPYTWWVHSQINNVSSAATFGTFTCNPPPLPAVAPAVPSNLSYQCNDDANQVTLSWSQVPSASFYLVRLNDTSNDSSSAQWNWYVSGTTDFSADNVTQTSQTAPVISGKNYIWWVQSYNTPAATSSSAAFGGFTCTPKQTLPKTINVKDFGAKGNGATDDSAAIQSAINSAGSGSTVLIPAGTYMLGTSAGTPSNFSNGQPMQTALWIKASNVTLKGEGASTILKLMPRKKMRAITMTGDYDVIDGVTFDGNKSERNGSVGYPDGDVVDALVVGESYRQHLTVKNCEIRNSIESGVGFWQNSYALVQNCYNHDNGTSQAGGSGIDLSGGVGNKALDNRLTKNTYGIWSSFGSNGTELRNNVIQDNERTALILGGSDPTGGDKNYTVDGNTISGNGWAAVGINYVQGGTFTNNKVINNVYDGIQIYDYDAVTGARPNNWSINWKIENNVCSNQQFGIRIIGAPKNISVRNNTCQNNGKSLADQIVVDQNAQVNSDWRTTNTISYSGSGETTTTSTNPSIINPVINHPPVPTPVASSTPATPTSLIDKTFVSSQDGFTYPSGSLVNDQGTIYFVSNHTKIPFTNWQAFIGLGYSAKNIVKGDLSSYTPSSNYLISSANDEHPWGSWLVNKGTIYYSTEQGLIPVPSVGIFNSNGGDFKFVVRANKYDIAKLTANIPLLTENDPRVNK